MSGLPIDLPSPPNESPDFRRAGVRRAGIAALLGIAAARLSAQSLLYVQDTDSSWQLVRDVREITPLVVRDGKSKLVNTAQFRLRKVEEYAPFFVSIRNLQVGDWYEEQKLRIGAVKTNDGLQLRGDFESAYPLDRVFLALDLDLPDLGKQLFIHEIGSLMPHQPVSIFVRVPIVQHMDKTRYTIHLFTGGLEVLHSGMSPGDREPALDRMVKRRIAGVENAMPKPFIVPVPEYPAKLYENRVNGTVKIRMRIGRNGDVLDPAVESASDPAFGESAIAAVRLWRFLPRIQDGHPIESDAEMPIDFSYYPPQHSS